MNNTLWSAKERQTSREDENVSNVGSAANINESAKLKMHGKEGGDDRLIVTYEDGEKQKRMQLLVCRLPELMKLVA